MTAKRLASRIYKLMIQFPPGTVLYHRATGKRGVVVEYCIDAGGCVMVQCDYGNEGWRKELPVSMSRTKLHLDEGEDWKNSEGHLP
jgi:hypothetical protein